LESLSWVKGGGGGTFTVSKGGLEKGRFLNPATDLILEKVKKSGAETDFIWVVWPSQEGKNEKT